jgi:methylated-DNA-[protein]-cysteine S-methyltransferase
MDAIRIDSLATPTGPLLVVTRGGQELLAVDWKDCTARLLTGLRRHHALESLPPPRPAGRTPVTDALRAYFEGQIDALRSIEVGLPGTSFQRMVWTALRGIPAGRTVTYGQLAALVGQPTAARAVGHANADNPLPLIVPCHRVIGADGSLTGFAGGLDRKRWLLAHEQRVCGHEGLPAAVKPGRTLLRRRITA